MLASLSNWSNLSPSQTPLTFCVTSFTLQNWQYPNKSSMWFATKSPERMLQSYECSCAFATSSDFLHPTLPEFWNHWTKRCKNINWLTSRYSLKSDYLEVSELFAIKSLQQKFITQQVLPLPKSTGAYTLDTDACGLQVGCILLQQLPEEPDNPIGYWFRSLSDAECTYETTRKECLAVFWTI